MSSSFPNSLCLHSDLSTTGISNANLKFNRSFQGLYTVQYAWLCDGNIPIVYTGVNYIGLALASDPDTIIPVILDDLKSDVEADISSWITSSLSAACTALGINIVAITFSDGYMNIQFDDDVIFHASGIYTGRYIFGNANYSSASNILSLPLLPEIFVARPKFIGIICPEADQMFGQNAVARVNMVISTFDTPYINYHVNFPDQTDELNLTIVRLNAADVECPITIPYVLLLSRNL